MINIGATAGAVICLIDLWFLCCFVHTISAEAGVAENFTVFQFWEHSPIIQDGYPPPLVITSEKYPESASFVPFPICSISQTSDTRYKPRAALYKEAKLIPIFRFCLHASASDGGFAAVYRHLCSAERYDMNVA